MDITQHVFNYESTSPELKPCPFCGGIAQWWLSGDASHFPFRKTRRTITVQCTQCFAEQRTSALKLSTEWLEAKALEKWNKRT